MTTIEIKQDSHSGYRNWLQHVSRTVRRFVGLPSNSVAIEEYRRVYAALEVAKSLILRHHDCSKQVTAGSLCPHCCQQDGTSPELDQIWDALSKPNPSVLPASGPRW
jgi:hypothetical protein